jgi:hypothetical protein
MCAKEYPRIYEHTTHHTKKPKKKKSKERSSGVVDW